MKQLRVQCPPFQRGRGSGCEGAACWHCSGGLGCSEGCWLAAELPRGWEQASAATSPGGNEAGPKLPLAAGG